MIEKKKILMLNYEFPPLGGGGGVAAYKLAKGFVKDGHKVDYITSKYKRQKNFEVIDGINIYRVKTFGRKDIHTASTLSMITYLISGFLKGNKLAKKKQYDIINTHFAIPTGPLGVILSRKHNIKNILTILGGDIYDPTKKNSPHRNILLKQVVKWVLNNSHFIISESSDIKNNAIRYYNTKKEIKIVPLSYEKINFKKINRRDLGLNYNKNYIISIGRLVKRKGFEYLVRSVKELDNKIEAIIVGDGPEKNSLIKLAKNLGLEKRIHFVGSVSEEKKFQYLANSDIYVMSSLHEGFGIVLQEAMQVGLPIISTNHGGQTDILKDDENAILIPIENYSKIIESVNKLLTDKNLMKKMSKENKEKIKEFSIDRVVKEYYKEFENIHNIINEDYYNKKAKDYDKSHIFGRENRNHLKKINKIISLLDIKDNDKILEIGVGSGIHAKRLIESNRVRFFGIDISIGMIEESKRRLKDFKNVELLVGKGEELDFKNDSFDGVFCSGTLHHMSDQLKGLKEMVRVLKKGRRIVVMEPNKYFFKNYLRGRFINFEKNSLRMTMNNFKNWSKELPLENIEISYFIYTPPIPRKFIPLYDKLDRLLNKVPIIKSTSIMIYLTGTKI